MAEGYQVCQKVAYSRCWESVKDDYGKILTTYPIPDYTQEVCGDVYATEDEALASFRERFAIASTVTYARQAGLTSYCSAASAAGDGPVVSRHEIKKSLWARFFEVLTEAVANSNVAP